MTPPENQYQDGYPPGSPVIYKQLEHIREQFGIESAEDSGLFVINHPSVRGLADQYKITPGLAVLLLRVRVNQAFSLTFSSPDIPLLTLVVSLGQLQDKTKMAYQLAALITDRYQTEFAARFSGNIYILCVSQSWLSSYLPSWQAIKTAELFGRLKYAFEHDPLLAGVIKTEVSRFWKIYPSRPLKQLFVSVSSHALLFALLERVIYHQKYNSFLSTYLQTDWHRIEMVQQHLLTHLDDPSLTPAVLAHMASMSLAKFNRLFKEIYQISVREFIQLYRQSLSD